MIISFSDVEFDNSQEKEVEVEVVVLFEDASSRWEGHDSMHYGSEYDTRCVIGIQVANGTSLDELKSYTETLCNKINRFKLKIDPSIDETHKPTSLTQINESDVKFYTGIRV
jgi:hypothetical protein